MSQFEQNPEEEDIKTKATIDTVTDKLFQASTNALEDIVDILYDEAKLGIKKFIDWVNE